MYRDKEHSVVCSQCDESFGVLTDSNEALQFCVFCGTMLSEDDVTSYDDDIE